jgi:hypothetical protein
VANAESSASLYPGWTCRFYLDETVPGPVRDKLAEAGAQVQMMTRKSPFDGLFWRFLPINDGHTRHFLVRDADSVINAREKAAVDDWLASGKAFHVMRDWWTHTEVMLAGLWGGVGGVLPPLTTLLQDFKSPSLANWHLDQWFLREMVWPTARQSCVIHDSKFRTLGARTFLQAATCQPVIMSARMPRCTPVPRDNQTLWKRAMAACSMAAVASLDSSSRSRSMARKRISSRAILRSAIATSTASA